VRGASKGEGLGNQFLATIREVDASPCGALLRGFRHHPCRGQDRPIADIETIETELMLADLDSLEKRVDNLAKKAKGNDKDAKEQLDLVNRALVLLREGKPARFLERKPEESAPSACSAADRPSRCSTSATSRKARPRRQRAFRAGVRNAKKEGAVAVVISAKIESEIATLSREERAEFLADARAGGAGLDRLIRAGYQLLDLITYLHRRPEGSARLDHHRGTKAPQAAGVIHTDFERGFIRAETIAYADYVALGGEAGARDAGKLRLEGKEYVVADGDVMHFRYNFSGDIGKMTVPAAAALLLVVMAWRPAVALLGAFGLICAAAIYLLTPRYTSDATAVPVNDGSVDQHGHSRSIRGFPVLFSIGVIDSAARMAFLTFLPFVLTAKGASLPLIGLALTLVFAGGAAGKLVCAYIGDRIGVIPTVWLTEGLTAVLILALLPLPLEAGLILLPLIGVALNGTSSVLYGSVPELVTPERRAHAFGVFYTGTIGSGALAPPVYGLLGDTWGIPMAIVAIAGMVLLTLPLSLLLRPALAPRPT
jgi:GTP-binding protein YchF